MHNLGGLDMRDLTGQVKKTEPYYFANGGFADIWRAEWKEGSGEKVHKVSTLFAKFDPVHGTWFVDSIGSR